MTYLALAKAAEARLLGTLQEARAEPSPAAAVTDRDPSGATPPGDALAALLDIPLAALTAPLAVDSPTVGRLYLVRDEDQARGVRAQGGVPYTPAEVAILREIRAAVPPEEWAKRLAAVHRVKVAFEGQLRGTQRDPEAARRLLHTLLDTWATLDEAAWSREELTALRDQVVAFWSAWPDDAQRWWTEWQAAHPAARLC